MNEIQREKLEQIFDRDPEKFTCTFCKKLLGIEDCCGCPIYGWGFTEG